MELQPKIEETEMFNFCIPSLQNAFICDKLFIGRVDVQPPQCGGLDDTLDHIYFRQWLLKLDFKSYLICNEIASETEKEHFHFMAIIPDTLTYKSVSDYFVKQIVKPFNLKKHQFSKKKNGARHHTTTNPAFSKILHKYNMEWYDYAACYYCKDWEANAYPYYLCEELDVTCKELHSRYVIIQNELRTLPKKKSNQNMVSLLIERWKLIHDKMVNPNLSIVSTDYVKELQEFIIDEISKNNKGNNMAHIFTGCRLKQYAQTILYTLNPEFAKNKMIYDYCDIMPNSF